MYNSVEEPADILDVSLASIFGTHLRAKHIHGCVILVEVEADFAEKLLVILARIVFLHMPNVLELFEVLELLLHYPFLEILDFFLVAFIELVHYFLRVPAAEHEPTLRISIVSQQILRVFLDSFHHLIRASTTASLLNATNCRSSHPIDSIPGIVSSSIA